MASAAQIETWITEAEAQRHALATGKGVVEVWRDGRRLTFTTATLADLNTYIATLKSELVEAQIAEGVTPTRRRRGIALAWRN